MSSLDEAIAACKEHEAHMPPQLAAWLVARETETTKIDQGQLGQALLDLVGGPGPEPLASLVARMLSPNLEHRFPVDGRELRQALFAYSKLTVETAKPALADFLQRVARMPRPRDSGEWLTNRPALDATGRVVEKGPQRPGPVPAAAFEPPEVSAEGLELARPARRPGGAWSEPAPYRDEPPPKRSRTAVIAVLALFVLAAGATAAFMFVPTLQRRLPVNLPTSSAHSLLVTSTPEGATVLIDGKVAGTTPLATDNRWRGRPRLELRLEGYEPFKDTFEGAKDQSIAATLKKK